MNKTRLENGRGIIPDTFGKPLILEASILVHVWPFCFYFGKNWNWKKLFFKIDSNQSPSYNMLKMIIGSFHGFGNKLILTWCLLVKSRLFDISVFFVFTCKSLNSSSIDPKQEILQHLYKTWLLIHIAFILKIEWILVHYNTENDLCLYNMVNLPLLWYEGKHSLFLL